MLDHSTFSPTYNERIGNSRIFAASVMKVHLKYLENNLKVVVTVGFAFVLFCSSVLIITSYSGRLSEGQKQEFLLNRHIKTNWGNFVACDEVNATQPCGIRSAKKAMKPLTQVMSKSAVIMLDISPEIAFHSPPYLFGSSVFEIIPCYHQFLKMGALLI